MRHLLPNLDDLSSFSGYRRKKEKKNCFLKHMRALSIYKVEIAQLWPQRVQKWQHLSLIMIGTAEVKVLIGKRLDMVWTSRRSGEQVCGTGAHQRLVMSEDRFAYCVCVSHCFSFPDSVYPVKYVCALLGTSCSNLEKELQVCFWTFLLWGFSLSAPFCPRGGVGFKTRFVCVALAVVELALWTSLAFVSWALRLKVFVITYLKVSWTFHGIISMLISHFLW